MTDIGDPRGILYPTRLPTFHREPAPPELTDRIRWFWIPRWNVPPGRVSRQTLLSFPASHLVVAPEGVTLTGPTTHVSHRDLTGAGWVVGASLRPAGLAALHAEPEAIRDREIPFEAPDLHRSVATAMLGPEPDEPHRTETSDTSNTDPRTTRAAEAFTAWALAHLPHPDEAGLLANAMEELIAGDRSLRRVDDLADRLHLSARAVQRLARRHVGLAPLAIIRRYRLQEAAQRLREDPTVTVAHIAAELGYADHAHLTSDFRSTLGFTPASYRCGHNGAPQA